MVNAGTRRSGRSQIFGVVLGLLAAAGAYGAPAGAASDSGSGAFASAAGSRPASAHAAAGPLWFDTRAAGEVSVQGTRFVDGYGREVVLRGFNVSGEAKLEENGGLPFASTDDARTSARALRNLAGGNAVRFLLSWAHAQPEPGRVDDAYLARATEQMQVFLDAGLRVFPDFHQDLFSRHLFNKDSWYTGDGAPKWVVKAGGYGKEFCGICFHWGQNITQNKPVMDASRDFWHNRVLATDAGSFGVQDAFLDTAQKAMTYVAQHLTADQFARVVGFDPYNEPYAGTYDDGQDSRSWERDVLWPFYERFRSRMDAAGWRDKPAFVEPNLFWNSNLDFARQEGGLSDTGGKLGPRYVFNTHFYDQKAISGIFMPGKAQDGQYSGDFGAVRERSSATDTPAVVSEFGHPLSGNVADKAPTVLKAMYQALESRLSGRNWWKQTARSGPVLSSTQWHWDIYSGRHHEVMNDNPDKVLTEADAWNDEDLSSVELGDSGEPVLRQDARLIDRLYPSAVAGRTLAFTYEDRSRDGGKTLTWDRIPGDLPNVARLVGSGQYGMLVWRSGGDGTANAPTELHLPRGWDPAATTVVSDLGTATGQPPYTAHGHTADHPIAAAPEAGAGSAIGDTGGSPNARRLLLSAPPSGSGDLHFALVSDGTAAPSAELRAAARKELIQWAARSGFPR
ncbi:cellulase family glycosylhydrolase [Streptomyces sp. 7N604]|uniref:cellulase family glycosylhydrolase n=1 Tax=Streptomyces sp. 7N604 TaxID=3457415 RepID=UPI003FD1F37C